MGCSVKNIVTLVGVIMFFIEQECHLFYDVSDLTRVLPMVLFFVYDVIGLLGKMFCSCGSCCNVFQCLCMLS